MYCTLASYLKRRVEVVSQARPSYETNVEDESNSASQSVTLYAVLRPVTTGFILHCLASPWNKCAIPLEFSDPQSTSHHVLTLLVSYFHARVAVQYSNQWWWSHLWSMRAMKTHQHSQKVFWRTLLWRSVILMYAVLVLHSLREVVSHIMFY